MTEPARRSNAERLASVGAELADERAAWLAEQSRPTVADEIAAVRREVARRRRRASRRAPAAFGLAAAVVAAAAVLLVIVSRPRPLEVSVAGGPVHVGERLVARSARVELSFDDGSRIALGADSAARMTALTEREVRLDVERGSIDVDVVHAEGRTWWIGVGASAIEVVGTSFEVVVDPGGAAARVSLTEGAVRVVGPCADPAAIHRAPATFRIGCAPEPTPPRPAPIPSVLAPSAAPSGSTVAAPVVAPWRAARARGDFRAAYELAAAEGLGAVAQAADAAELLDLALGARLSASPAAGRLYRVIRERFAGSDAAAGAAFHLGRAAFDGGAWGEAEGWFAVHLAERPGGPLAAEALGRSIECSERRGALDQARAHALRYLERFPDGPQASRARRLVEGGPIGGSPADGERGTSPPP